MNYDAKFKVFWYLKIENLIITESKHFFHLMKFILKDEPFFCFFQQHLWLGKTCDFPSMQLQNNLIDFHILKVYFEYNTFEMFCTILSIWLIILLTLFKMANGFEDSPISYTKHGLKS
jgi:hypothetical protein